MDAWSRPKRARNQRISQRYTVRRSSGENRVCAGGHSGFSAGWRGGEPFQVRGWKRIGGDDARSCFLTPHPRMIFERLDNPSFFGLSLWATTPQDNLLGGRQNVP